MNIKTIIFQCLRDLYRKYLKKYRYIQILVIKIYNFYNTIIKFINYLLLNLKNIFAEVPFVSMTDYIKSNNIITTTIVEPEVIRIIESKLFPSKLVSFMKKQADYYQFPKIFISDVRNAKVAYYSNLVITDKAIIRHDLYNLRLDILAEEYYARAKINVKSSKICWHNQEANGYLPEAACFSDSCSPNYAHWLTEILPRIYMFANIDKYKNVPLLVDKEYHENVLESLKLIVSDIERVKFLESGDIVHVDLLHVMSPTGYIPFKRRTSSPEEHSHGIFSHTALLLMRDYLQKSINIITRTDKLKIFLRRNSHIRSVTNEKIIEESLVKQGFTVIEPEKLSFREQIKIFSQAEIVVGATGSAIANMIFCKPKTRIVILIPEFANTSYWYWQNIASAVGNMVTYVVGERDDNNSSEVHVNFQVDLTDVINAISD